MPQALPSRLEGIGRGDGLEIVEAGQVGGNLVGVGEVHVAEASAPDDVGFIVASLDVHGLSEGFIGGADEAYDLGIGRGQRLGREAVQGLIWVMGGRRPSAGA